jgi:hypothetical protein
MKKLLGVVIIVNDSVDTIYKIFEAKDFDNNIDILNDYADPLHEPMLWTSKKGIVRQLEHEPNPAFWKFVTTKRLFYGQVDQILDNIREECNKILNSEGEL